MELPIQIDDKGKISIEGYISSSPWLRDSYFKSEYLFITNKELKEDLNNPIEKLLPEKTQTIYFNRKKISNELFSKIETVMFQNLKFRLTHLRFYKRNNNHNLWITSKTECIFLDPEIVKIPEPVWYDIVAVQKNDQLLLMRGEGFRTEYYENVKDNLIDTSMIDNKLVPCIQCKTWTLNKDDICIFCKKKEMDEYYAIGGWKNMTVSFLISHFNHCDEFNLWKYKDN